MNCPNCRHHTGMDIMSTHCETHLQTSLETWWCPHCGAILKKYSGSKHLVMLDIPAHYKEEINEH